MRIETALGGGALLVVASVVALPVVAPGAIASPSEPTAPEPPADLSIAEVAISPGETTGATATLRVDARLTHRRGPAENVTVEFRAVDDESGLVETVRRVGVGTVDAGGERRVRANLTVAREGGYLVETVVYRDGRRVATGRRSVAGVGSLQPAYADVPVEFHRFSGADLPAVEYSVAAAGGDRVALDLSTYLTNTGDRPVEGLRVVFMARQEESGIVADEASVSVGAVAAGRTAEPGAELTVPDGYNYYLDAVVWRDGVVVTTARSAAVLVPEDPITVNESAGEDGLRVEDFDPSDGASDGAGPGGPDADPRTTTVEDDAADGGGGPGLGVGAALAGLLLAALAARRWSDE